MRAYFLILFCFAFIWSFNGIAMDPESDSDCDRQTELLLNHNQGMQTGPHFLTIPGDVLGVICTNFSHMPVSSRIRVWGGLKLTCKYLAEHIGALEKNIFYSDDHDAVMQQVICSGDVRLLRYLYNWDLIPADMNYMHKQFGTVIQQLSDQKKQFQAIISQHGDGVSAARQECEKINGTLDAITIMIDEFDVPDVAGDDQSFSLKNMMFWTRGSTGCCTLPRLVCGLGLCCCVTTAIAVTIIVNRLLATGA